MKTQSDVNRISNSATKEIELLESDYKYPKLRITLATLVIFLSLMAAWAINQIISG